MSNKSPYLRLVRSSDEADLLEVPNVRVDKYVTPSQAEAIEVAMKRWDKINFLPGILDVLEDRLEAAMKSSTKVDYFTVAGMAEGIAMVLDGDPRVDRFRERAVTLGHAIGDD